MVEEGAGSTGRGLDRSTWGFGDVVLGIGLALFVPSVVVVIALAIAGKSSQETDTIPLWAVALLQIPLWVVLFGVPWWVTKRKGRGSLRADFGFAFRPIDIVIGLVAGFGGQIVIGLVLIPVYDLLRIDRSDVGETARSLGDRVHDPVSFVSLFIVAVLAAALLEELFYRGLVLSALRKRWGDGIAIAASAVIFGVMHFQPVDTIALALFGAILAWLAVHYGRLGPSICAHLAFNLTAFISLVHH
jgi:membrane protease YdiL (CAAX protease family)